MTAGSDRVPDLFAAACERPAAARIAWLRRRCGDDRALFAEVASLLAADAATNPLDVAAPCRHQALLGQAAGAGRPGPPRLPRYRIERELGAGGMGVVWLAHQVEPVERPVALKVLESTRDAGRLLRGFERERDGLAAMRHTGIAQIYDAGQTDDGRPFVAMEYIEGRTLARFAEAERLSLRERLALLAEVCDAVQHAHDRGIVHCDLKPSNILVQRQNGRPLAKIIDFGISHALGAATADAVGDRVGTPGYVSPERLQSGVIGPAADVYALGVVMLGLVAGAVGPEPRPSALLMALSAGRRCAIARRRRLRPAALLRECRGDLDWIVARATATDPAARYARAADLGDDLRRYLAARPVLARPGHRGYVLARCARRHRVALAAATVVSAALVAASVAGGVSWRRVAEAGAELRLACVSMIDRARDHGLASAPGGGPVRARLLADGLRICEGLLARDPDDDDVRRQVSRGRHAAGLLAMERGEWAAAERSLRRAISVGTTTGAELDLIRVLRHQHEFAVARRRLDVLLERLGASATAPWPDRAQAAAAWTELAWIEHLQDRGPAATAAARQALALLERRPDGYRDWYLASRAEVHKLLAVVTAAHQTGADFSRWFEAAVADARELIGDARASERRHLLALTYDAWAIACLRRGDAATALVKADRALAILDVLVVDHPDRAPYAASWLMVQHKRAEAMLRLALRAEAVQAFRHAVVRAEVFVASHPGNPDLVRRGDLVRARLAEVDGR